MNSIALSVVFVIFAWLFPSFQLSAQVLGSSIELQDLPAFDRPLLSKARALRQSGKLLNLKAVARQLANPVPGPVDLLPPRSSPLLPRDIAKRTRASFVRIGWYHLCPHCDRWHLKLAGAYPISKDTLATCYHEVEPGPSIREGYLLAVDSDRNVWPVTNILAAHAHMDVAIVRVATDTLIPLPLQENIAVGDPVWCLSDPFHQLGYFSSGIVNRFYWLTSKRGTPGSLEELSNLRLNTSTDWAPGSSGAPILDESGNVIGHVSRIATFREAPSVAAGDSSARKKPARTPNPAALGPQDIQITLHEGIPARSILALLSSLPRR